MTAPEVADVLRCTRRTVENLVARGELRPIHVGRLVRFRSTDIDAYIDR